MLSEKVTKAIVAYERSIRYEQRAGLVQTVAVDRTRAALIEAIEEEVRRNRLPSDAGTQADAWGQEGDES